MPIEFIDLDVRPILRDGGEPFDVIMKTLAALGPRQGIRLLASFKPVPLFQVLGSRGFTHEATELGDGDWEVLFAPEAIEEAVDPAETVDPADHTDWPCPDQHLDNRDLEPPEPMVRIMAEIETMRHGQVLSALLCREPMFLFPELERRGHQWHGAFEPDGTTYKILVRVIGESDQSA